MTIVPSKLRPLLVKYRQLLIYTLIGGLAVVLDFGVFTVASQVFNVEILLANVISTSIAVIYSFAANMIFNFKLSDKIAQRFLLFIFVAFCGFLVSTLVLWILAEILTVNPVLAKGVSLPLVLLIQYLLNSRLTFQTSRTQ